VGAVLLRVAGKLEVMTVEADLGGAFGVEMNLVGAGWAGDNKRDGGLASFGLVLGGLLLPAQCS
jgi:hypothetical protein